MDFVGTWDLTVHSPMGAKTFRLEIGAAGDGYQGTATANGETHPLVNPLLAEGRLRWSMKMPRPMNVVLEVEVAMTADDALAGWARAGRMSLPEVRGVRVG
jgi:hypothetical protein